MVDAGPCHQKLASCRLQLFSELVWLEMLDVDVMRFTHVQSETNHVLPLYDPYVGLLGMKGMLTRKSLRLRCGKPCTR